MGKIKIKIVPFVSSPTIPVLSVVEQVLRRVPQRGRVELLLPRRLRAGDAAGEAQLGLGAGGALRRNILY